MNFSYTAKSPLSSETQSEVSCSYSLRPRKKKSHETQPKKRRTNSLQKAGPLSTETRSEASFSYSLRPRKEYPLRWKMVDLPQKKMLQKQRKTKAKENNRQKKKGHAKGQKIDPRWLEMKNLLSTYSEPPPSIWSEDDLGNPPDPFSDDFPDDFYKRYTFGELLAIGSYARVYTGVRKSDGAQVAIKYLYKLYVDYFTLVDGRSLPHEGVLMDLASKPRRSPYVIKLLDLLETSKGFLLIMERPHNFITLKRFRKGLNGRMSEDMARIIMRQIIRALIHCRDNGVLHRNVREHNFLVNPETLELKMFNFGRARLIYNRIYKAFGDYETVCPIRYISDYYWLELSSTVMDVGTLLYTLIRGKAPPRSRLPLHIDGVSEACTKLIRACLQKDHEKQPFYELILWGEWCLVKDPSKGKKRKRRKM